MLCDSMSSWDVVVIDEKNVDPSDVGVPLVPFVGLSSTPCGEGLPFSRFICPFSRRVPMRWYTMAKNPSQQTTSEKLPLF